MLKLEGEREKWPRDPGKSVFENRRNRNDRATTMTTGSDLRHLRSHEERFRSYVGEHATRVGRGVLDSVVANPLAAPTEESRESRSCPRRAFTSKSRAIFHFYILDKWKAKSERRLSHCYNKDLLYRLMVKYATATGKNGKNEDQN